jgi:hypothetical protein
MYATVQPDKDLLVGRRVGRGEEPEEQIVLIVGVTGDGKQPGVGLADVKVDIRDTLTINSESYNRVLVTHL